MTLEIAPEWHQSFYNSDEWMRIALGVTSAPAHEVDFIIETCGLEPGRHVVDVPCGHGRHSLELARRGCRVTGIDTSVDSIEYATETAKAEGLDGLATFRLADMRGFELERPADAAIIIGSSFGMLATDEEHLRVLETVHKALAPKGRLLIDVVSVFRLARSMVSPRRWERLGDGTVHCEERSYDFATGRRNVKVEMFTPDGQRIEMSHSIRLYFLHELVKMLEGTGFAVIASYGGFRGQPIGFDEKRVVVVAEKA